VSENQSIRSLGAVELRTRREVIVDRLRDAVIEGTLAPGTHLGEVELSESLGVSRGTLREAFRHLQQEGLLVSDARGRLSVRSVSPAEVTEIFQVRESLEALGISMTCALPDRSQVVADLEAALSRLDSPDLTVAQRVQADLDFHEIFLAASGNATLVETWRWISGFVRVSIVAAGTGTAMDNMTVERHRPILNHVKNGDPAAARAYLSDHMTSAAARIIESLQP
jgi:DNA-binding GntR family transcriptional regulator